MLLIPIGYLNGPMRLFQIAATSALYHRKIELVGIYNWYKFLIVSLIIISLLIQYFVGV